VDFEQIRYEVAEGVLTITLNRPERLNAFTQKMGEELIAAFDQADADDEVRVVIVTGEGRGFCAGADLAGGGDTFDWRDRQHDGEVPRDGGGIVSLRIFEMTKPVIAAINGPAAGVGLVLALFCDLRFAAPGAKLTTSFGRLGLPAEHGTSWLLPRLVGRSRAADLLFSSRVVLAEEAVTFGLVDRVCAVDETLAYARTIASEISPSSLATMKRQLWDDTTGRSLPDSIDDAYALLDRMVGEPDFVEGVKALQEKRPPRF
jgi:enoyl-CoA hydratase/carnithine racemase